MRHIGLALATTLILAPASARAQYEKYFPAASQPGEKFHSFSVEKKRSIQLKPGKELINITPVVFTPKLELWTTGNTRWCGLIIEEDNKKLKAYVTMGPDEPVDCVGLKDATVTLNKNNEIELKINYKISSKSGMSTENTSLTHVRETR